MNVLSKFAALVVAKVPYIFGNLTLGYTQSRQASSRWYSTNDAYRFPIGSKIYAHQWAFGYGVRVEGVVVGHENRTNIDGIDENTYVVEVTQDSIGDWYRWQSEGYVNPDAKRITRTKRYCKWNLENQWANSVPWQVRLKEWAKERLGIVSDQNDNPSLFQTAS